MVSLSGPLFRRRLLIGTEKILRRHHGKRRDQIGDVNTDCLKAQN